MFLKKVTGRSAIEDALRRLDKLTQEEHRMTSVQGLRATHDLGERVIDGAHRFFHLLHRHTLLTHFLARYREN